MKKTYRIHLLFLSALIFVTSFYAFGNTAYAASGWLKYVKEATLGKTYSDSVISSDYYDSSEGGSYITSQAYWDVYKFTLKNDGVLTIRLESESDGYFSNSYYGSTGYLGFTIFSGKDPDKIIWNDRGSSIYKETFSSARNVYYASTKLALSAGTYYLGLKSPLNTTPYYLTLSATGNSGSSSSSKNTFDTSRPTIKQLKGARKNFVIKVKSVKNAKGYQIQYKKSGKWQSLNVSTANTAVSNLKRGNYSVRVRAFTKMNGKTRYSQWSSIKKVIVK